MLTKQNLLFNTLRYRVDTYSVQTNLELDSQLVVKKDISCFSTDGSYQPLNDLGCALKVFFFQINAG